MATTTTATTADPDRPPHLRLDSIPTVDLHLLSQSELYSLSKCSNSSFDLNRCDDVVIPKIDRSVFNESAGSRKQTYSRLRLAPAVNSTSSSTTIHRRTPHLRPSITPVLNNVNDTEQVENSHIIHALKQLFKSNPSFDDYVAVEVEIDGNEGVFESLKPTEVENYGNGRNEVVPESLNSVVVKTEESVAFLNSEMKRKRGRPRKHEKAVFIKHPVRKRRRRMHNDTVMKVVVYDSEIDKELVNCGGVKVDLVDLGKLEDPYGSEIRKRTEGLLTSDELLGFLRGLKGEWGTTRKKRRVVDASDFGDALPKGWRLSLCIKRKGGRVWVFCRRYISPSGRYFESCKDVSMYLLSIVGEENLDKPTCTPGNDCDESALTGASGNAPDVYVREDLKMDIPVPKSLNPTEVEKDRNVIVPEPLNSIEVENDGDVVVPELSNSEMRRKRGRPRKHENEVIISPPVRKRMRNDTVKKVVVYDSDMDREIVNCKGVKVDLVNLGRLEDPYGPEIGRRTEGMLSADELLGFLRGLNGQWGTTRKKRRVIDASDFGDALPKGWRLSLCIKRKDGRVWVFCRRYISPSGRQFESCKDVSMYLLSVVGEENLDKPTSAHNIDHDDSALKGASGNDADLFVREDLKTNDPVLESSNPMEGEKDRKIDNPESPNPIEVENAGNVAPELSNSERRRKRGRPRKNENAVSVIPPVTKRMHNDTVKKLVVYDTDKDREIVNCRGVKVNLVNLGRFEDPYGPEIRMRTEGMLTSDELLGFLRGLNGEWGTTRKKRRVVDASDFGDALPKGWRLSLCIKRKDGRVWLFCRRYISPSGRQFESCKDISGYLLSIVGEENLYKPSCAHSNDSDESALKVASGNAADIYVQEDLKRNIPVPSSSALPISLPIGFENQVTSDIGDPVVVQEVYKCLKCFMIFEGKIDLLDHQALAHKDDGSQSSCEIPDWSIVIGGIFECKFCRKTFYEKNQYNGHIGTHVMNESKTSDVSAASAAEKTFDAVSIAGARNDATETHDAHFSDKLITASSQSDHKIISGTESKIEEVVHDLNMDGDVLVEESGDDIGNNCNVDDNASDVLVVKSDDRIGNNCNAVDNNDSVIKSDFCLGHEASIPTVNEIRGKFRSSGRVIDAFDAKSECMSGVQTIIVCEEKGFRENINGTHVCSSYDKLASEKEKAVNTESSSGVFHGHIGLDDDCLAESEKLSDSESLSLFSPSKDRFKTVNGSMIPSKSQESQKLGFDATVDQVTHGFDENRFSYGIATSKHDEPYKVRSSTFDYYQQNEHVNKEKFHIQNNVNNTSLDKSGGVNLDSFYNFKNNGSINNKVASFGSSQNGLNAGVACFNTEKQLNISPPVPPGNQQAFDFQDDVTGLYDSAHGSSQKGLLDHFCVAETSDDIFGSKLYSTPLDGLKFDEGIHELSLAFGNPHPHALYADKMSANEQKKDGVNCSVVPSKIENPFDVQTDLSMVNNSMVQDLKRGSESVDRSFSLSRNGDSRAFQHNGNTGYSGRTWEDPRLDEFRSSDHNKFMMGSGSNQRHHNEAVPRDIWKSAERNQPQSGFVNPHAQTQTQQTQSPSFHSFDIMSAKAEDGVFRLDERYNGGMSVSRSEPVEFRFLSGRSEHNPHALQGGSRVLPYDNRMEQAFDSNFWMGNPGMMPNMGGRNVVTSVCAWCRNQFQMPAMAMHPESQGGAGSLCPTCSAGFSGQVNML